MPASRTEQVLQAIEVLLGTIPEAAVERNSAVPEKIPAGGLIILRDGDPGEPEQALGGFANAYYQHAVEIEVLVEEGDAAGRDTAFDGLLQQIGTVLDARRPRLRDDLRPTRAGNRGGARRAGDQERHARGLRRL